MYNNTPNLQTGNSFISSAGPFDPIFLLRQVVSVPPDAPRDAPPEDPHFPGASVAHRGTSGVEAEGGAAGRGQGWQGVTEGEGG